MESSKLNFISRKKHITEHVGQNCTKFSLLLEDDVHELSSVSNLILNPRVKMTSSEKLFLQWNEFQNVVTTAFGDFRNDEDFTDVTLVCEDGKQIEAHKVVLASTSPFFLDLLKKNKHPHPLIYMKGIKSENLLAMVDFFYKGEANISHTNLEDFLSLADDMRLKGLRSRDESNEIWNQPQESQNQNEPKESLRQNINKQNVNPTETQPSPKYFSNTALALESSVEVTDVLSLTNQIKSMVEKGGNRVIRKIGNGKVQEFITRICKVCGKEGVQSDVERHIEAKHITGVTHACDVCETICKTRNSLRNHKSAMHRKDLQ